MLPRQLLIRAIHTSVRYKTENKGTPLVKELLENSASFEDTKPKTEDDVWATLPYPEGTAFTRRDQGLKSDRPKIDPKDTTVILFPGQGAQYVGMAKNLMKFPEARDIFELANEVLK